MLKSNIYINRTIALVEGKVVYVNITNNKLVIEKELMNITPIVRSHQVVTILTDEHILLYFGRAGRYGLLKLNKSGNVVSNVAPVTELPDLGKRYTVSTNNEITILGRKILHFHTGIKNKIKSTFDKDMQYVSL